MLEYEPQLLGPSANTLILTESIQIQPNPTPSCLFNTPKLTFLMAGIQASHPNLPQPRTSVRSRDTRAG